jgi:S1-C subfamily serine protease
VEFGSSSLPRVASLVGAGAAGAGVALAVVFGLGGLGSNTTTTIREIESPPSSSPAASTFRAKAQSIAEIYKRSAPGVVQITATSLVVVPSDPFFPNPFGLPQAEQQRALGSGFVIDKAGYIVTNYHVIAGAKSVEVSFSNNESMKARIVGSDPSTDLAVLKVNTKSRALTPLVLGDSDTVQVGDSVVAIGNPFGLARTVTAGIVSALQRPIQAPNGYTIDHVIQTDAPINRGNSGGPLIGARGEVIGVNSQLQTGGSGEQGNIGIGFAIPSNTVKTVAAQLINNGKVEHAYIGINAQAITPRLARVFRLPVSSGLIVEGVQARSAAANAGIRGGTTQVTVAGESYVLGGDVIVRADGVRVGSLARLRDLVQAHKPGETMTIEVYRVDTRITVKVKLGRQPE